MFYISQLQALLKHSRTLEYVDNGRICSGTFCAKARPQLLTGYDCTKGTWKDRPRRPLICGAANATFLVGSGPRRREGDPPTPLLCFLMMVMI